jgi:hypothetical protein
MICAYIVAVWTAGGIGDSHKTVTVVSDRVVVKSTDKGGRNKDKIQTGYRESN